MFILAAILLGLGVAMAAPILHARWPAGARWLLPLAPLALAGHLSRYVDEVAAGATIVTANPWVAELGLALTWRLDGLSLLFALLITGVGALILVYAGTYLHGHRHLGRLYGFLLLFMTSMVGLVLTDNLIALFVFWELTSISSYFLIGFEHERAAARAAALQALLVTSVGGLALLAGAILLGLAGGSHELSRLAAQGASLRAHPHYHAIGLLIVLAAFTKSAQAPFGAWLPGAMEAPTPVSAYLHAATMVKAGVYLLARMTPVLGGTASWRWTLVVVGGTTMILGAVRALRERHIKRVLAQSTVSALGVLVFLLGMGTRAALEAMVVYLVAHALYKGALFLVAGAVDHGAHETDVEQLHGLRRRMRFTAVAAVLAAASMAGVPPLLGYVAKEILYGATLSAGTAAWLLTALAFTVNALIVAVAINVGIRPFLAGARPAPERAHEVAWTLWAPPLLLALGGLTLGLWGEPAEGLLAAAASTMTTERSQLTLDLWHGLGWPLALGALTLLTGVGLFAARCALRRALARLFAPAPSGPSRGFTLALRGLASGARAQTRVLQSGHLRRYLLVVLATTLGLVGGTLLGRDGAAGLTLDLDVRWHELVIVAVVLVATVTAVRASSRFTAILAMGVVGYGVALVFILFGAPDLGITQIIVETLTVIFLILAFHHLPPFATLSPARARVPDAAVAFGFGALMTLLVLAAQRAPHAAPISSFYGEASLPEAHGRNVVNVILVDFRALDTLGEITVIAIAALGVVGLLARVRARGAAP